VPRWVTPITAILALPPTVLAYAALLGLGLHRHGAPWAVALVATLLVYGPAMIATWAAPKHRVPLFLGVLGAWSLGLLLSMPVYFPGERQHAVATGLALVARGEGGEGFARGVAASLPEEPAVSEPEVPLAAVLVEAEVPPPAPLTDREIALPYDGEGRRLAVPVAIENGGRTIESWMLLDTGATYTTLPLRTLAALGIVPGPDDPQITLHTANGEREARVVLVDKVWLGDLAIEGVAIATCDECASGDTIGLLGLNVTGGYNLLIDADRREAVFSSRTATDRRVDVSPFVDLSATFTRFPGGRVEVAVRLRNDGPRTVTSAEAGIHCGAESWLVAVGPVAPGGVGTARQRLPEHPACDGYRIALEHASW